MIYGSKNCVAISIFFWDMAFQVRQGENKVKLSFSSTFRALRRPDLLKRPKMFISCLFSLIFSYLKLSKRLEKFEKINLMRDPFEAVYPAEQGVSASLTQSICNLFYRIALKVSDMKKWVKISKKRTFLAVLVNLVVSEGSESAWKAQFSLFSPCLTRNAISQKKIVIATQFLEP